MAYSTGGEVVATTERFPSGDRRDTTTCRAREGSATAVTPCRITTPAPVEPVEAGVPPPILRK
jgi:hypothetical protein